MVKTQNIDVEKLAEVRKKAAIKTSRFCHEMGVSRQSFYNKCKGKTQFRMSEVFVMATLLGLSDEDKNAIFFPE